MLRCDRRYAIFASGKSVLGVTTISRPQLIFSDSTTFLELLAIYLDKRITTGRFSANSAACLLGCSFKSC